MHVFVIMYNNNDIPFETFIIYVGYSYHIKFIMSTMIKNFFHFRRAGEYRRYRRSSIRARARRRLQRLHPLANNKSALDSPFYNDMLWRK